ncbi:hypothetical protein E6R60_26670 [Streptomyces sp. A0642]|uniref:hypothetical protein n=1 Tax=Streptomyces sp. A0642 TaxID=2563100 RepID=UPI0010A27625|nr:hypothetical protein [Streptomyces sp. A0642]THA72516.1 hypothetical protein E6R60_26670 [Streptomyces sp. A0642]
MNVLRQHAANLKATAAAGTAQTELMHLTLSTGQKVRSEVEKRPGLLAALPTQYRVLINTAGQMEREVQELAGETPRAAESFDLADVTRTSIIMSEAVAGFCEKYDAAHPQPNI